MKDSRRDVDARKKRKQIEKEMMKLQAKIGRKVGRSRSGSKDAKERASNKRKSESGEESMEGDSDEEEAGKLEDEVSPTGATKDVDERSAAEGHEEGRDDVKRVRGVSPPGRAEEGPEPCMA